MSGKERWYVVHTYSGYENKVKTNIEKMVDNHSMRDVILDVQVPLEEVIEMKDNQKKVVLRKKFPGYVLVKMIMTDETWYIVRNTRGVTGFVGPASKPVPLTEQEVEDMGVETQVLVLSYDVGDSVRIKFGPLENFTGVVEEISVEKKKVKVLVSMFGRDTAVELEVNQVEPL